MKLAAGEAIAGVDRAPTSSGRSTSSRASSTARSFVSWPPPSPMQPSETASRVAIGSAAAVQRAQRRCQLRQRPPDSRDGLGDALLVLDEREADVTARRRGRSRRRG